MEARHDETQWLDNRGNVEMRNHGWPMNRETKSNAIYKLNQAQLIGIHPQEPGKSVRVFRPDIKGEYDGR